MKKIKIIVVSLVFIMCLSAGVGLNVFADQKADWWTAWSGSGSIENPFLITSKEDLINLSEISNNKSATYKIDVNEWGGTINGSYFKQTRDIDLTGINYETIGSTFWSSLYYEGNNFSINNYAFNSLSNKKTGIFGFGQYNIKNLTLTVEDSTVVLDDSDSDIGTLIANASANSTVENCFVLKARNTSKITIKANMPSAMGEFIGGVVGRFAFSDSPEGTAGLLKNVYSDIDITVLQDSVGNHNSIISIGGLVGSWNKPKFENCAFTGKIVADFTTQINPKIGGLLGKSEWAKKYNDSDFMIENCYVTAHLQTNITNENWCEASMGGFIGELETDIVKNIVKDSYFGGTAESSVTNGQRCVGSFIGYFIGKIIDGTQFVESHSTCTDSDFWKYYSLQYGGHGIGFPLHDNNEDGVLTSPVDDYPFAKGLGITAGGWKTTNWAKGTNDTNPWVTFLDKNPLLYFVKAYFENIKLNSQTFVYDKTEKSLTISGDSNYYQSVVYSSNNSLTNVGSVIVTATVTLLDNKTKEFTATLAVTEKILSVNWNIPSDMVYNGQNKIIEGELTATEILVGDEVTLNLFDNTKRDSGSYIATASLSGVSKNNYKIKDEDKEKSFSIKKKQLDVIFEMPTNLVYDGQNKVVVSTAPTGIENESFELSLSNNSNKNVGEYIITASLPISNNVAKNYSLKSSTASIIMTITPKILTSDMFNIDAKEFTGNEIEATINATGLTLGVDFDVTGNKAKEVGKHIVTITGKGNYSGSVNVDFEIKNVTLNEGETKGSSCSSALVSSANIVLVFLAILFLLVGLKKEEN